MGSAYSLTSDEALMERVKKVCEEHLHMPVSSQLTTKSGGSEDVSYMMRGSRSKADRQPLCAC